MLFCFDFLILCLALSVNANVEKVIFTAPRAVTIPNVQPGLEQLRIDTLSPSHNILETQLPVQFPTAEQPRGRQSWYLLRDLEEGRRYEVRICWLATQPTDFWLHTYPFADVLETLELIASLADYSEQRQFDSTDDIPRRESEPSSAASVLFLRVDAAASFYSLNKTLMEHPPPVDVDIILDPYILNVLPRSLGPTAIYIVIVAVFAFFFSDWVWKFLVTAQTQGKPHED